jgi:hypothetical protein
MAAVLRLPLSAVVLATLLSDRSGPGVGPLIIVGVVIAYLTAIALDRRKAARTAGDQAEGEERRMPSSTSATAPT